MVPQAVADVLAKIDTDTTALAAVVNDLRSQIKVGMSPADVASVQATLEGIATRLEATAADPENPVPVTAMPRAVKKP